MILMRETTASYSFPVLGGDRMDYEDNCAYATHDWDVNSGVVQLRHRIDGDSLVASLVKSGKANFGVVVVMKATMYRKTFIADGDGALSVSQTIAIEKGNRSLESPKFLPMVIYRGGRQTFVADKSMGLDEFWHGRKFDLLKGAIVARDKEYEFQPGLSRLLRIRPDVAMPPGAIQVDIAAVESGYFIVKVSPDFYREMRRAHTVSKDKAQHRDSILAHALSAGFAEFAKRYSGNEELQTLENFQTIKRRLEAEDVATWEDGDKFDACRAAWVYLPHRLLGPEVSSEEETDE